jgi:hypothetical protein
LLGLKLHPFKTLRAMFREKDRSQQLLVLGLPGYVFVGGLMVIGVARVLIGAPKQWGWLAKLGAGGVTGLALFLAGYLLIWLLRIWQVRKRYG